MRMLSCVAFVFLVSCAPREAADYAPSVPGAHLQRLYVATQKALDRTGQTFGEERTGQMRHFRADISIPPTHRPGHVSWPKGPPDAATDFVVAGTDVYPSARAFIADVKAARPGQEMQVFVHGYNVTLSEGLYRLAQMREDFKVAEPSVLFAWASAGDPRGYVYDRDSVLYARDDLEELLTALTSGPGDRVTLLAHSMGAHLVMEVMRQAALKGERQLLDRISGVVLMSPDIDPDIFRRQAEAIGDLPQPFLIFVTQQDRALSLASLITGRKKRLGVIDGPEAVAGLPVKVIDFTALADGEGLDHAVAITSPSAISVLNGMLAQASSGRDAFEDYMVLEAQP
ncbi:MAG: alpha/beta hydrolase [Roseovarius sp.]